jgi:hypothetical protein
MPSVQPAAFTDTIAADAIIALTDPLAVGPLTATTHLFRMIVDGGHVTFAAGTAGEATIGLGLWVVEVGDPAPTSWAARTYGHRNMHLWRGATVDRSHAIGAMIVEDSAVITAGDWEIYLGLGVEDVGTLNGEGVTGVTPSGVVTVGSVVGGTDW